MKLLRVKRIKVQARTISSKRTRAKERHIPASQNNNVRSKQHIHSQRNERTGAPIKSTKRIKKKIMYVFLPIFLFNI